jgi:hypothetical protein
VSIDAASSGFPVAFMSLTPSTVSPTCGTSGNVLVTTYSGGSPNTLTDESWYGFFY